jgi:hypothetical protein
MLYEIRAMAATKVTVPFNAVERNIRLTGDVMRYLIENPRLFTSLPEDFNLVILPEDDPEMRLFNLDLLDQYSRESKPIVFVRLKSGYKSPKISTTEPSFFVPV